MMFSRLLGIFGKQKPASADMQGETFPHSDIPYQPDLINQLKSENRQIISELKALRDEIKQKDPAVSRQVLEKMKRTLLDHFVKENNFLFNYIQASCENNANSRHAVVELKREMDGVQSMMMLFFSTYLNVDLTEEDLYAMGEELSVIGKVLEIRIKREEKELYPLYSAPKAA